MEHSVEKHLFHMLKYFVLIMIFYLLKHYDWFETTCLELYQVKFVFNIFFFPFMTW